MIIKEYSKTEIAYMIRCARRARRMTIENVADALKIHRSTVQHWEHGRRVPSAVNALQLSKLFDIPLERLCARSNRQLIEPKPNCPMIPEQTKPKLFVI